ncbi:hypothetical protein [Candidatus Halobonum tyrrellensis]|uniref:Uncharacterized protein n=1 Tax=Candidatus Halobonum tyrrellensis G22 TaxID=1324957 RepID=V4HEN8_9EURY|nr:hypothetical protein [Candidatus Halobonum tyrrellensis]ESP88558.1 hypothetical protein K933_08862 [Candidatus Halobonum tyrrellensis G22]
MRDKYKELMLRSFKDGMDVVDTYNEWAEKAFDDPSAVPAQAVPQVAMALYQSRVMDGWGGDGGFDIPEFDDKMFD